MRLVLYFFLDVAEYFGAASNSRAMTSKTELELVAFEQLWGVGRVGVVALTAKGCGSGIAMSRFALHDGCANGCVAGKTDFLFLLF